MKITLGIIREEKVPADRRVPFTPAQARAIMEKFPHVTVVCQPSTIRCFKDEEYASQGITLQEDLSNCDILMGVKEVPVENLIPQKTCLFFSHTMKQQPHNKHLLRAVLDKKIHLVDYEILRDPQQRRLVAFGRYAGIVGAYNGLWTYGKKYRQYDIRRAYTCYDLEDLKTEFKKISLPPIKIALTGSGRVGQGAMEVLDAVGVTPVGAGPFLTQTFDTPVYTQLKSSDYHYHKDGRAFDRTLFHTHPEAYTSDFVRFTHAADILIAGAYWNPRAPVLFTREDMADPRFKTRIIADISCDIQGSIPATLKATNIEDPIFDYDPIRHVEAPPLSNESFITVMAIDNLPCELPRSASKDFGHDLTNYVLPALLGEDPYNIITRGTIAQNGTLMDEFKYLETYAGGA